MGSASCKNPKSSEQAKDKAAEAKITIGVFGLHDAGKTSTVKTIEGAPTNDVEPTMASETTKVLYPTTGKNDKKSDDRVTIIDVSGSKNFRQRSWPEYYRKIHGLIYVLDASDKKSLTENQTVLDDLLDHDDLKDKPILILANKKDRRGAMKTEDEIKDRLKIDELRRKHKIEICSAIPGDKNKPDASIRQGFSWLIRAIEEDYTKINARVKNNDNSSYPPKPMERKTQVNNRRRKDSDQSDSDNGIVYAGNRPKSPQTTKKSTDYRQMTNSVKLPILDLNKTKGKQSGNQTYSESDHEDDTPARSRANFSRPTVDSDRHDIPTTSSAGGMNKKKKLIGASSGNHDNDLSTKKSNDSQPKSFRSSYEPFPEESPWSASGKKVGKPDDLSARSFGKPSTSSDFNKRTTSPLVHDTKPYGSSALSKRDKDSGDEDDEFNGKAKLKTTLPYTNKSSTPYKKPLSSIYGGDEDEEEDSKSGGFNPRSNQTSSTVAKKPYKPDIDFDYLKKSTTKPTTSFGSDDESKPKDTLTKPYSRSTDRFDPMNEYRGITAKPPPSPSFRSTQSKLDDDRPSSSSLAKPNDRFKSNKDDFSSTYTKPTIGSRFNKDDGDSRPLSASKKPASLKGNDDDYLPPLNKSFAGSKYGEINRAPSPLNLKSNTPSKYGDDDLYKPLSSKPTTRANLYDKDRSSPPLKPAARSRFDDDEYGSPSKVTSKPKFDDDDDLPSSTKPATRSTFKDNDRSSSPYNKPTTRSKYGDDDDDDDKRSSSVKKPTGSRFDDDDDLPSSAKPATRSTFKDNDRYSSPYNKSTARPKYDDDDDDKPSSSPYNKPTTRSRYDDHDDDDKRSSSVKKPTGSRFDDDDDLPSSTKPATRSTFKDNDRYSSPYNKSTARSNYDDDDDDKPSSSVKKPVGSRFDDDDDLPSSTKPTTRSPLKDNDRFSSSYNKPITRSNYDDDDRSPSSPAKRTTTSRFEDDDDDLPKSTSKTNNYPSRDTNSTKPTPAQTRFSRDPYDS